MAAYMLWVHVDRIQFPTLRPKFYLGTKGARMESSLLPLAVKLVGTVV